MTNQTTTGFLDALANYLASVSSLGLTKGTNLFAENFVDDPDVILDQFVIFDEGADHMTEFQHLHLNWTVRILTTRKKRLDAVSALSSTFDHLLNKKRFVATSDSGESFIILKTRSLAAPDLIERTESGRFASAFSIQLELIPD